MKRAIDVKTASGYYKSFEKEFKDEQHLANYIRKMNRMGSKVIGVNIVHQ